MRLLNQEKIDDVQINGLKIIQRQDWFSYGVDAVALADFVDVKKGKRILDMGTGTGIIPLLLSAFTSYEEIIGIEIQASVAKMAQKSVVLNELENRISIVEMDINDSIAQFGKNSFDTIVTNPPYMAFDEGMHNENEVKAISRHEIKAELEDIVNIAADLLKDNGNFYMIHRPHRLVDIFYYCRKYRLEPKLVKFIHPKEGKVPNIVLIKCTKFGKAELKYMPPLNVYDENGTYTESLLEIYRRKK